MEAEILYLLYCICLPLLLCVWVCLCLIQIRTTICVILQLKPDETCKDACLLQTNDVKFVAFHLENLNTSVSLPPPTRVYVCVFPGSEMWLRYHPHGSVLVYRVYASGCDCPTASRPLSYDGHHDGWSGTVLIYSFVLHYVLVYMYLYFFLYL